MQILCHADINPNQMCIVRTCVISIVFLIQQSVSNQENCCIVPLITEF